MLKKQQVVREFKSEIIPIIRDKYEQDGVPDYPARREAWNNYIDALIQDGVLPERAGNWAYSDVCNRRRGSR